MGIIRIQIQSVLYHNKVEDIEKAICNLSNAISVYEREKGGLECKLCYGDASNSPIFSEKQIEKIQSENTRIKEIKSVFFQENTGTAKGHNLLAKSCETDYIMIMNPDVLVSPRFFVEMLCPFSEKEVGLTEARQTPIEHPKDYNKKTFETSWSTTACVMVSSQVFREVNGFDEKSFFMYCDDVDFSWRIRLEGYKLIYRPNAVVYHAKRLSANGDWQPTAAERYYSAEAALMMAYKWSNKEKLKKMIWDFKRSKDEVFNKAVNEFTVRQKRKELPKQLDVEHKIATFVDGEYARHRYVIH